LCGYDDDGGIDNGKTWKSFTTVRAFAEVLVAIGIVRVGDAGMASMFSDNFAITARRNFANLEC
jgi:hypothetical protein